jgi:phosphoglycolate phosphatase
MRISAPSAPSAIAAIAFDLDGTLVDSAPDIGDALNFALAIEGLAPFDVTQVIQWIGDGPDALIDRALAHHGLPEPDRNTLKRVRAAYDEQALRAPLGRGKLFAGITELLTTLEGRWPLAVVTNKPPELAAAVLATAGIATRFVTVHGASRRQERKPEPFMLLAAAERLGVATGSLLMVGDSLADLGAAAAAGCPVAYALWGYGKAGALQRHPGAFVLERPEDLLPLLPN